MILPENQLERHAVYRNLGRECATTRAERGARYLRLRTAYLTGSDQANTPNLYNGLMEYVSDATAQLYAPSAVRFGVVYPPTYGDDWTDELEALTVEAHRLWHDTRMTLTYGAGVRWARILGISIFKNIVSDGDPILELIPDPSDFGVWNELLPVYEQEAVCHYYDLPLARFERIAAGYPNGDAMVRAAKEHARPPRASTDGLPPAMSQIVLTSGGSPPRGVLRRLPDMPWTTGQTREPCVPMTELWVRDDHLQSFRRVGICDPMPADLDILWDEPAGTQYDDEHPFHALTFEDVPGYMWGLSPMDRMIGINDWEQTRWANADLFMQLQLKPPYFVRGIQGRDGEKTLRARMPGGEISSNDPTAEVKSLAPPAALLGDLLALIDGIRKLRDRQSGLGPGNRGEPQPGIRGGDQEALLLGESSIRSMWDASFIEVCAGEIMTQALRMQRRRSDVTLRKPNGEKFTIGQMPGDFVARVAAHSASPLYAARVRQIALILKREGAIGLERFVELMDPPLADLILPEARKRERAQSDAAQHKQELTDEVAKARVQKDTAKAKKDATDVGS